MKSEHAGEHTTIALSVATCRGAGEPGGHDFRNQVPREVDMLKLALTFFLVGLVAALLGFTGIAGASFAIAKVFAVLFAVLFLIFLILGLSASSRIAA